MLLLLYIRISSVGCDFCSHYIMCVCILYTFPKLFDILMRTLCVHFEVCLIYVVVTYVLIHVHVSFHIFCLLFVCELLRPY